MFKWWPLKKRRRPRVARFEIMCRVVARRDRHPLRRKTCILGQTYASSGESPRKYRKVYDAYGENLESLLPTKDTWLLNKAVFRRLFKELKYKTKIFCFGNEDFSYMAYACVRESTRAQDIGMTCDHSCGNVYVVAQCVCNY